MHFLCVVLVRVFLAFTLHVLKNVAGRMKSPVFSQGEGLQNAHFGEP